jgi:hypothetical protein
MGWRNLDEPVRGERLVVRRAAGLCARGTLAGVLEASLEGRRLCGADAR